MVLSNDEVRRLYRKTAPFYDAVLGVYRLLGVKRHRRATVAALRLGPGDKVVDLGCGTGANFPFLREAVGPDGTVIGVDLTDAMLERARTRIEREGWTNVGLVECDVNQYRPPSNASGVVATFALEMIPTYDHVIQTVSRTLPPGSRLALLGLKHPEKWPDWLIEIGVWLNRPFGVSREYEALKPWTSIRRHMKEVEYREFFAGALYRSVGEVWPKHSDDGDRTGTEPSGCADSPVAGAANEKGDAV